VVAIHANTRMNGHTSRRTLLSPFPIGSRRSTISQRGISKRVSTTSSSRNGNLACGKKKSPIDGQKQRVTIFYRTCCNLSLSRSIWYNRLRVLCLPLYPNRPCIDHLSPNFASRCAACQFSSLLAMLSTCTQQPPYL
jgi:hypothetical protein